MKRADVACLFLCLTPTFLFSQSSPAAGIDNSVAADSPISPSQAGPKDQAKILVNYGRLPLSFEANRGQIDARVKFLSRSNGYSLFLTRDEAVLVFGARKRVWPQRPGSSSVMDSRSASKDEFLLKAAGQRASPGHDAMDETISGSVLRMKLRNANLSTKVSGVDELPGKSNYLIGNDPARWRSNVPSFAKVKYEGIYSGIDLLYYGNQQHLEYDFIVAPGADPRRIGFDVRGANQIPRNSQGDLVFKVGEGEIHWRKPLAYQEKNGVRHLVAVRYLLTDKNHVGFVLAKYDVTRQLYIDPLIYSTYLSGGGASGNSIAVDSAGNTYVTGKTVSTDFPVTAGAFQGVCHIGNGVGCANAFVTKINPSGSALVYSTYLGGSGGAFAGDSGFGVAVDSAGNAYVTGGTYSSDFPTTPGSFQTTTPACGFFNCENVFLSKLDPTGSALVYSTYLGGSGDDSGFGIAVDATGHAYITGVTHSGDFPTTSGAFQTDFSGACCNAFVTKFNLTGSALVYSTYLGGSSIGYGEKGYGIAVDSAGSAYVTGLTDSADFPTTPGALLRTGTGAFVSKLSKDGSALVYSTYLGGERTAGAGIAVDSTGSAYVTGVVESSSFPTTPGAFQTTCGGGGGYGCLDVFVTKFNPTGSALIYSTFLGGNEDDFATGIALDSARNAYVTGITSSLNFPTAHPLQPTGNGPVFGQANAFITKVNPTGSALVYSTYFGSNVFSDFVGTPGVGPQGLGIAVDSSGNAHVIGTTGSNTFPTMRPLQPFLNGGGDAFVAKISAVPSDITQFPLHLNFSGQPTGVASNPQVSVLNNASNADLTITSINITGANSGDFAQTNNCGTSVPPGTSCSITVTFTPKATGNRSAVVKVADSAPQQSVSLTGLGLLDTVTKLTSNPNPSALGKGVTFKATVSSPSGGTPTGSVDFVDGGTTLANSTLIDGEAKFATNDLPLGLNAITALYSGDSKYGFSNSELNQHVLEANTHTTLTSLPNPSFVGQAVRFTAKLSSSSGTPLPDGETITFSIDTRIYGTAPLKADTASLIISSIPAGAPTIRAAYAGDDTFIGSFATVKQIVNRYPTSTVVSASVNPSVSGQAVSFTATVTSSAPTAPTGWVTFKDGSTVIGAKLLSGGKATLTRSTLSTGKHSIIASYHITARWAPSVSPILTQVVQ